MNIARIVGAAVLLLSGSAAAQDGGKVIPKTTISLGTATPGGGFPIYGNALAEVLNGADATLSIEPRNTRGSSGLGDKDVAHRLAKSLHGIEAALCRKLPQACETTAANTVAAAIKPELIHPGVLKYVREIGVAK